MRVKLKVLKKTRSFYIWMLEEKKMTDKEEYAYLKALESIERIIDKKTEEEENKQYYIENKDKMTKHNRRYYKKKWG